MVARKDEPKKSFAEFLRNAPTLEEAAADDTVEISGLVSRTGDGRFAITTDAGQTYELEIEAVRDFRALEVPGAGAAATIRIGRDVLNQEALRPIKPMIKDAIKDPIRDVIKDIIHDGKHMITDPLVDAKSPMKDLHKDPLTDPTTFVPEGIGTGAADPIGGFDPGIDPRVNPAAPFVMATPHQAPAHLLRMQAGVQAQTQKEMSADETKRGFSDTQKEMTIDHPIDPPWDTYKEMTWDTRKEMIVDTQKEMTIDTHKEMTIDTHKELIRDTLKEMTLDTLVEGGPNTLQEGIGDPGQWQGRPGFGPRL